MPIQQISAQRVMEQVAHLSLNGNKPLKEQSLLNPPFVFGGDPQEGSEGRLKGQKVLVYGGGDVWYKFIQGPLRHLGIDPKDITIVETAEHPIPQGLEWQYKGVNVIRRKELDAKLAEDSNFIKKQNFDFAVVATPPSAHEVCAKEAIENGLPVFIEKPMFKSTAECDNFKKYCDEKGAYAYAIDWQRSLSTLLYSTLGQETPFADAITYGGGGKAEFAKLANEEIEKVSARFVEGRGNALLALDHRGHLAKASLGEKSGWASAGMFADMGIHPLQTLTSAGFKLNKVIKAFFGGASDEHGYRNYVPHDRKGTAPEMYSRVDMHMSWENQSGIPVEVESGKGSKPNVNDGRTIFHYKSGKKLVHEFGHKTNQVTLYDKDGKVLATAIDRGEPYERMFLEGATSFKQWAKEDEGKKRISRIAYGKESREAIRMVEEAHRHACDHPAPKNWKMRQLAIDEMGPAKDVGEKAEDFKIHKIGEGQYKTVSPKDEVFKESRQWHSTAENASYDKQSGCFWYVDIEHGLLTRYNTKTEERKTWQLTPHGPDDLDEGGRPKQMLSVVKVNEKDGSVMVMLSGDGPNAGLNYFNPETAELTNIGKIPKWEKTHPDNRFNDETTLTINGKNLLCYGTMSKHWDKRYADNPETGEREYARTGAYYVVDPDTMESHKLTFEGMKPPLITNGLADGGTTADGKKILFWSETVEDPGKKGTELKVYRGVLDPNNWKVSSIEVFKHHDELGGMMNGVETFGRPDGATMGKYHGKDVYGISILELGEIRFLYSDPKDPNYKKEALRIQLPDGMTRDTQFALGEDKDGKPIGLVTTQDAGHFSRRWNVGEYGKVKARDGLNGKVISFALPEGLTMHPQAVGRMHYPSLEELRKANLTQGNPQKMPVYETEMLARTWKTSVQAGSGMGSIRLQ